MDRMRSLRKIPTQLHGTNFCTTSARIAPSFVRQPNGQECRKIVRNLPKCQFRFQWGGLGAFVVTEFSKATKRSECTQIVRNASKRQFTVQWGGSEDLLRKIPTRLRGTNFCTSSARFAPSFVRQPNGPECMQIVRNTQKH